MSNIKDVTIKWGNKLTENPSVMVSFNSNINIPDLSKYTFEQKKIDDVTCIYHGTYKDYACILYQNLSNPNIDEPNILPLNLKNGAVALCIDPWTFTADNASFYMEDVPYIDIYSKVSGVEDIFYLQTMSIEGARNIALKADCDLAIVKRNRLANDDKMTSSLMFMEKKIERNGELNSFSWEKIML